MRSALLTAFLLFASSASVGAEPRAGAEPPGEDLFTTRVRPILARHCLKCHGQDDKTRKAKMRLDIRAEAIKPAGSGFAPIVPGNPEESELISRIFADEPDQVMPPPQAKIPLSEADKQVLKRWVAEGAEYRTHWAYVPPRRAPLPRVQHGDWPRGAIDSFILARLEAAGLEPGPQADRHTLIRRLSLDLLGLPPTPEQVEQFVGDTSPEAYENLVDRLLASPHYGERWGRRWLDLARYADTNGYEKDRPRSIWPYRDWVIRALNDDLPFDQFTIAQLAGDMLPGRTADQRVATGFHRNTMLNEEGGIDPLEFRFHAMTDRVATTGTVWLGLTIGCAQCHTHKFDPIPHREYYRFMALLNNADEPEMQVPSAALAQKRTELEAQIARHVADLPSRFPVEACSDDNRPTELQRKEAVERGFRKWLASESAATVQWEELTPVEAKANLPLLTIEPDGAVFASGDQSKRDVYTLRFRSDLRAVTALRLEVLPDPRLPSQGPGRVYYEGPPGDFFLSEFAVLAGGRRLAIQEATASFPKAGDEAKTKARAKGKGKGKSKPKGNPAQAAIDGDPQTGWTINGGQGREHAAVFRLAEPLADAGRFDVELLFERYHAAGLGRFRILATTAPDPGPARETPRAIERLLLVPDWERTPEQTQRLFEYFLLVAPELAGPREAIDKLRQQLPKFPTSLVMEERPAGNPRPTHVHNRGEFLQPTERVEPAVPSVLPPLPADAPKDRLALARWLVSDRNPLTARVTMNRQWAALFGQGLVRTTEDFGYQGDPPTHPELLDWLALEFAEHGWSLKRMHKLIVMSATYRQSSRVTPEALAKDPENRLLSHAPRVRLDAEVIRDQALRVSGLLSERVGGPSVFPPQPPGVTTEGAYGRLDWKVSDGGDRYRRGLYTFSKRTAPYAMFTTFDAPSGEVCIARREVSNTPLQALTLLNDPVFEEAAQTLGRRMAAGCGSVAERVDDLFRRCLTRPPLADERDALVRFYHAQKARLDRHELDAVRIAGTAAGASQRDAEERAAWTLLVRVLLNLDETITKG